MKKDELTAEELAKLADIRAWCTKRKLTVVSEKFWEAAADAIRYMTKELQCDRER